MILVVNVCFEKLHYFEFVKPIEDILRNGGLEYSTIHYTQVSEKYLASADRIIICGTSLKDDDFLNKIEKFSWINNINKPVLGICAGMHVIGLLFGGDRKRETEIGFYEESFQSFLGLNDNEQVYHLHNNYIDFFHLKEFEVFSKGRIPQAVKHRDKELYGILFHPEVRQKSLILNFCSRNNL
jgi:GMP synthase-like glutamine amidotransferase